MDPVALDYWLKALGLTSVVLSGLYATVRTFFFCMEWYRERVQKEKGWSGQAVRIGQLADKIQGLFNEFQHEQAEMFKRYGKRVDEIAAAQHEHEKLDTKRFDALNTIAIENVKTTVENGRALGRIEGMLEAQGKVLP